MDSKDIFIGPLLRRAQQDLVVICLATFKPFALRFSLKVAGQADWLGHDSLPLNIQVTDNLYFYFGRVTPSQGKFPTDTLLSYSIGEVNPVDESASYTDFEKLAKEDDLAYGENPLPTFFLQSSTRKLNALYGSCRKIHDEQGGKIDALSLGDTLIAEAVTDLDKRPAILCLGGDQIYADDVHATSLAEILALARKIEGAQSETLPNSLSLPGSGARKDFVKKHAMFTSDDSENHLVTFAEYLAMYGLMWNRNNWANPGKMEHFTNTLVKVRRLLANIPSYMIFDDHDVTDDWNLSLKWRQNVNSYKLGKRIVANALMAFWLCQGYGNDPGLYSPQVTFDLADQIRDRHKNYGLVETIFWAMGSWEFFTHTYPFIYFLDTRTQRGLKDGPMGSDQNAPAYLKSLTSWIATYKRLTALLQRQSRELPLVLVSAAPVFGFDLVELGQKIVSSVYTPYFLDFESWAANQRHLMLFLQLMGDKDVVLLSGDVHYAFTSTIKFSRFDDKSLREAIKLMPSGTSLPKTPAGTTPTYKLMWTAKFLQLTSSALKNYANDNFTRKPANYTTSKTALIFTEDDKVEHGIFENDVFLLDKPNPVLPLAPIKIKFSRADLKPSPLFRQRINDAFNSRYIGEHNIGLVTFKDRSVTNAFYTSSGKTSELSWDFSNGKYWE